MMGLKEKRIVVTGVGTGIGSAVAVRLADEGAQVAVNARDSQRLERLVQTIQARGGQAHALPADLLDPEDAARLAQEATKRLGGPPQVLVNAVGAWALNDALEQDPENVRAMLDGNLRTIMNSTPPMARLMKEQGGGSIVNIGAVYGHIVAKPGQSVYNAAKAGVVAYTKSLARELLEHNIRVNCVLPGGTRHDYEPGRDFHALRRLGKDKIGTPEDIANAIAMLTSDDAAWITGATLPVDGGDHLRGA